MCNDERGGKVGKKKELSLLRSTFTRSTLVRSILHSLTHTHTHTHRRKKKGEMREGGGRRGEMCEGGMRGCVFLGGEEKRCVRVEGDGVYVRVEKR